MKLSSKPISSPGRTEKFPPPLMRFLRSNVGSRSRGRSRSSPMFVRKKNAAIETQEPSSPKVTCIGQVRVRRSKQTGTKAARTRSPAKRRCRWIRDAMSCTHFSGKLKRKSFRPSFRKWVSFFQRGFRRKVEIRSDSSKVESKCEERDEGTDPEEEESDGHEEEEEGEEEDKNIVCSSSTPPKNALLLTRCRSAPYRSSSLAGRFWGSPLATKETGEEPKTVFENRGQPIQNENPTSETEPVCGDSIPESTTDPESEEDLGFFSKQFEGSINERSNTKSVKLEKLKTGEVCSVRPLVLTRCKSEPARTGEKLHPEASFWRKTRLGFTDSVSPHVCD